jgi:hypothetical protein
MREIGAANAPHKAIVRVAAKSLNYSRSRLLWNGPTEVLDANSRVGGASNIRANRRPTSTFIWYLVGPHACGYLPSLLSHAPGPGRASALRRGTRPLHA